MTQIPAILVCDTREQQPYQFARFTSKYIDFAIQHAALDCGDYAAYLYPEASAAETAAVERKSLTDLFGSLTTGRERFERELEKLTAYGFRALVVEGDLRSIARGLPESRANPTSIIASLVAFSERFDVHIIFAGDRRHAQAYTWRLLERWARDKAMARAEATELVA